MAFRVSFIGLSSLTLAQILLRFLGDKLQGSLGSSDLGLGMCQSFSEFQELGFRPLTSSEQTLCQAQAAFLDII